MSQPWIDCLEPCVRYEPSQNYDAVAAAALWGGLTLSAFFSVITLEGPRRNMAGAILFILCVLGLRAISYDRPHDWFSTSLISTAVMLALVSIVYWPVRSSLVNLPLVGGGAIASVFVVASVITPMPHY